MAGTVPPPPAARPTVAPQAGATGRASARRRPVFVDRTGRRLRLARLLGGGLAVTLVTTMGLLAFALSGAGSGRAPDLPGAEPALRTRPAPSRTTAAISAAAAAAAATPGATRATPTVTSVPVPTTGPAPTTRHGRGQTAPPGHVRQTAR